jgi:cell division transport system ATP-binding protein
VIQFFGVSKSYGEERPALDDVSFRIPAGQFVFLKGASGAGKSTLLRLIFREATPTKGRILVNGRNVAALPRKKIPYLRRTIGVVFQNFSLIDRKTVFENVCYLPKILGATLRQQKRLVHLTLSRVGLAERMDAFPHELSGGEQQRVAIARALINEPEILVADEPTGNLDPGLSDEILRLFVEINQRGTTVVFATHDPNIFHRPGDRILVLERGRLVRDRVMAGPTDSSGVRGDARLPPPGALLQPEGG